MHAILESTGLTGRFSLGAIPTALTGILPRAIRRLAKLAPKLTLEIKPGTSESIFSALSERKIDAGVFALPPFKLPSRFTVEVIRKEPLVLLSKKGAGKTRREKLENNPYVCFDSKSWAGSGAVKFLKDQKIHIQPSYELDALEPIEKIVQEGMGVTLVPLWSGLDTNSPELELDIINNDTYSRKVALVSPNNGSHPKVITLLREALLADMKSL
jgi:DNA-binding transcriptional LysR family regulator